MEQFEKVEGRKMKTISLENSWADTYAAQSTDEGRAAVLLAQAYRKGSKRLIADLLQQAMDIHGYGQEVEPYLEHHGLPYSQDGLLEAARRYAESVGYDVTQ
jgi:hypothetical protein